MAKQKNSKRVRKPSRGRYFLLDKELHKVLFASAPANLVEAWNYNQGKRVNLLYSDYAYLTERVVSTQEVAKMLNISAITVHRAIESGGIRKPNQTYPISNPDIEGTRFRRYYWGIDNIYELHDYLMTVHWGRPRGDGGVTPNQNIPPKSVITAEMSGEKILFVKGDSNEYVPVYEPPTF